MTSTEPRAAYWYNNVLFIAPMCFLWINPIIVFWAQHWASGPLPWWALVGVAVVTLAAPSRLSDRYYQPSGLERGGGIYERLGIRVFKRWVPSGDAANRWIRRHEPGYRVLRDHQSVASYLQGTRSSEQWHLAFFVFSNLTSVYAAVLGELIWALYLMIANVAVNLYPVLLQRYNRARLMGVRQRWR